MRPFNDFLGLYIVAIKEPRGVIWNFVVRASLFKDVLFTINSKSHESDMFVLASILFFPVDLMERIVIFYFRVKLEIGGHAFPEADFMETKYVCTHTSL